MKVGGLNALIKILSPLQDTQIITYSHVVAEIQQTLFSFTLFLSFLSLFLFCLEK